MLGINLGFYISVSVFWLSVTLTSKNGFRFRLSVNFQKSKYFGFGFRSILKNRKVSIFTFRLYRIQYKIQRLILNYYLMIYIIYLTFKIDILYITKYLYRYNNICKKFFASKNFKNLSKNIYFSLLARI